MDEATLEALKEVVDYLEEDEHDHWEEDNYSGGHIYLAVLRLKTWLQKSEQVGN